MRSGSVPQQAEEIAGRMARWQAGFLGEPTGDRGRIPASSRQRTAKFDCNDCGSSSLVEGGPADARQFRWHHWRPLICRPGRGGRRRAFRENCTCTTRQVLPVSLRNELPSSSAVIGCASLPVPARNPTGGSFTKPNPSGCGRDGHQITASSSETTPRRYQNGVQ